MARGIVGFDQDALFEAFEFDDLPGRFEFGRFKVSLPGIVRDGHAEDAADRPGKCAIFNILIDAFGKVVVDTVAAEASHQVKLGQRGVAGEDNIDLTLLQFEQGGLEVGAFLDGGRKIRFAVLCDARRFGRRGDVQTDSEHIFDAIGHELFEEIFVVGLLTLGDQNAFLAGGDVGFGLQDVER